VNTLNKSYPFLIAAIVIVAIGAPMAQGTGRADPVAALTLKVKALQARVASLEAKSTATDSTFAAAKNDIAAAKEDIATVKSTLGTTQQGVAALQSTVSGVQSAVGSLNTCLRYGTMPVARYKGYLYAPDGGALFMTTALDYADPGQTPSSYLARVNPSCVSSSAFALSATSQTRLALGPAFTR
jgi:outer membrane murein-binding lipoprotein Lpp